ncbi:MAG: endonuclease domain-containing protein [Gammaproteobacteria bacterium]
MDIRQKAKQLRSNSTDAERNLWAHIRNRRLEGWKFRRQLPIGRFIVDFACAELRIIVEIDGGQHAEKIHYDLGRTRFLQSKGYQVVRYWNNEVLGNIEGVLEALTLTLSQRERELAYSLSPQGRG